MALATWNVYLLPVEVSFEPAVIFKNNKIFRRFKDQS